MRTDVEGLPIRKPARNKPTRRQSEIMPPSKQENTFGTTIMCLSSKAERRGTIGGGGLRQAKADSMPSISDIGGGRA